MGSVCGPGGVKTVSRKITVSRGSGFAKLGHLWLPLQAVTYVALKHLADSAAARGAPGVDRAGAVEDQSDVGGSQGMPVDMLVADVHILAASSLWQALTQGGTSQGSSRGAGGRTGTCNSRFESLTFHVSAPKPREAWGRTSLEPGVPGWLGMRP